MKKNLSAKLNSLVLAVMLLLSLTVTSFAVETSSNEVLLGASTTGSIQVTDATAADTFAVYQVMKVTYTAASNALSYEPTADFTAFLANATYNKTGVTTFADYQNLTDPRDILGQYTRYCVAEGKTAKYTITGSTAQTGVELGQYVLYGTSTDGTVYQSMTASFPASVGTGANEGKYIVKDTVTLTGKKSKPSVDKVVTGTTPDPQVAVGDTVNYTVTASIPAYPSDAKNTTFKITDTLSGLTDHKNMVVSATTDDTVSASSTWTPLAAGTDYTVDADTGVTSVITFKYDKISGYKNVKVTYDSKVTTSAVVTTGNENTATLEYSNAPYADTDSTSTPTDKVKVYTYEIDVNKEDATASATKLDGVTFNLSLTNGGTAMKFTKNADGDYTYDSANGTVTDLVTANGGKLNIRGLDVGTYYLKETKTISGYALPKGAAATTTIVIADADKNGLIEDAQGTESTSGIVNTTITNAKINHKLPLTGGIGTYVFIAIGLTGMIAALIAFAVTRKKYNNADNA